MKTQVIKRRMAVDWAAEMWIGNLEKRWIQKTRKPELGTEIKPKKINQKQRWTQKTRKPGWGTEIKQKTWIGNRKQKLENRDWKQRYNQKTGLGTENKGLKTGTAAFFERNHACGCQQVFSHPNLYWVENQKYYLYLINSQWAAHNSTPTPQNGLNFEHFTHSGVSYGVS